jgi:hypothetical protein
LIRLTDYRYSILLSIKQSDSLPDIYQTYSVEGLAVQLDEFEKTFRPIDATGILQPNEATLPLEPKAMHDEMGEVYDDYGRMSGMLGLTRPIASSMNAPFIPYGYASPPVDIIKGTVADLDTTKIGTTDDGTQIWKITHNGVDIHTIHTHLFDAQLVNRVAWDGAMIAPDENKLGWKETFRVNPLEHTIIAMRPKIPEASIVPFDVPNSVRLIDPTMPEGTAIMPPMKQAMSLKEQPTTHLRSTWSRALLLQTRPHTRPET